MLTIERYVRTDRKEISFCYKKLQKDLFKGIIPVIKPRDKVQEAFNKLRLKLGLKHDLLTAAMKTADNFTAKAC